MRWNGRRPSIEDVKCETGANRVLNINEFDKTFCQTLDGKTRLYSEILDTNSSNQSNHLMYDNIFKTLQTISRKPVEFFNVSELLTPLRLIKDCAELTIIRETVVVTAMAFKGMKNLIQNVKENGEFADTDIVSSERDVDAHVQKTYTEFGGCQGYRNIVACGDSATCLHYTENCKPLVFGEFLLMDSGCELFGYTSDVTRTYVIGRTIPDDYQKKIYDAVLEAQLAAIYAAVEGATLNIIQNVSDKILISKLKEYYILNDNCGDCEYKKYTMHGIGHFLGLDVHDVGGKDVVFRPGMVITVEPGLYFEKSDTTIVEGFRGIGVRIEDNILITQRGNEVLTASIPK